jgi:hypothetical protein
MRAISSNFFVQLARDDDLALGAEAVGEILTASSTRCGAS